MFNSVLCRSVSGIFTRCHIKKLSQCLTPCYLIKNNTQSNLSLNCGEQEYQLSSASLYPEIMTPVISMFATLRCVQEVLTGGVGRGGGGWLELVTHGSNLSISQGSPGH